MDVLGLILVCSMYPDEHLVRAMVDASSQGNQYFVADLATLVTFDKASTAADARTLVGELEKQGGKPLVGILGLPPAWVSRAARSGSKTDLFDACTNIRIGTSVLAEHYDSCLKTHTTKVPAARPPAERSRAQRTAPPEAVRACALRRFGTDLGFEGYAEAVLGYLPRQRVLFAPSGFTASADGATGEGLGAGGAQDGGKPGTDTCRCEEAPARPARKRPARADRNSEVVIAPGGAPIID